MKFGVFTHAEHILENNRIYSYAPYVKEMNLWIANFDEVLILAPNENRHHNKIEISYVHSKISFEKIPLLHFKKNGFFSTIKNSFIIFMSCIALMKKCDHIHIRCPGNIGLIALIASIFFPGKPKTIKYAGNWDPDSNQPASYDFQKWLLQNNWLVKNKKVIIYGEWPNQSPHIISFFTASFSEMDKIYDSKKINDPLKFIFCGSLVKGKGPLIALQIVKGLIDKGFNIQLSIYGTGSEKETLQKFIVENNLSGNIVLYGNQPHEVLKKAYKNSHFCILPSKSEGWPKAIAEGMFFGCVPIVTNVSCVSWMLDGGKRGIIISENIESSIEKIISVVISDSRYTNMSQRAMNWSGSFTLEKFEIGIKRLL